VGEEGDVRLSQSRCDLLVEDNRRRLRHRIGIGPIWGSLWSGGEWILGVGRNGRWDEGRFWRVVGKWYFEKTFAHVT